MATGGKAVELELASPVRACDEQAAIDADERFGDQETGWIRLRLSAENSGFDCIMNA